MLGPGQERFEFGERKTLCFCPEKKYSPVANLPTELRTPTLQPRLWQTIASAPSSDGYVYAGNDSRPQNWFTLLQFYSHCERYRIHNPGSHFSHASPSVPSITVLTAALLQAGVRDTRFTLHLL
jgi:hypothetical protein